MSPAEFLKLVAILLATSVGVETALLAGVFRLDTVPYHLLHVAMMGVLVVAQFALYVHARKRNIVGADAALALAVGAAFTAIGDFVNSAASNVTPVSMKLTWALLLFGIGYTLYVVTLFRYAAPMLRAGAPGMYRWRWLLALAILAGNVAAWQQYVEANVAGHALLYYGSFVFNATIYVLLPTVALWLVLATGRSLAAIVVCIGAILVPYSDLVLFNSWLRGGDPAAPDFALYSYNWIVYFSGQLLFATFPALRMAGNLVAARR